MKPLFEQLNSGKSDLISIKRYKLPHFYKRWHYHEEPEIIYVVNSEGKRIIGDSIGRFSPGDLYILGSHLPHLLLNDPNYFKSKSIAAEAIVVHVNKNLVRNGFLAFNELKSINILLAKAGRGLHVADTEFVLLPKMISLSKSEGLSRMQIFLDLLTTIIGNNEISTLASEAYRTATPKEKNIRLDAVYEFITSSFDQKITLNELAEKACMTPPAFCAYFKRITGKTPFEFLNDIRIGYACRLLTSEQSNISQIALSCGFSNLSFFNRQFKTKMNMTPRTYKNNLAILGKL